MKKLPCHLIEQLRRMPESGMGYQVVDVVLNDGRMHPNQTVVNGDTLQAQDIAPEDIRCLYLSKKTGS